MGFYKSVGSASGHPGRWYPFDGFGTRGDGWGWFDKTAYSQVHGKDVDHPLHRYDDERLRAFADDLADILDPLVADPSTEFENVNDARGNFYINSERSLNNNKNMHIAAKFNPSLRDTFLQHKELIPMPGVPPRIGRASTVNTPIPEKTNINTYTSHGYYERKADRYPPGSILEFDNRADSYYVVDSRGNLKTYPKDSTTWDEIKADAHRYAREEPWDGPWKGREAEFMGRTPRGLGEPRQPRAPGAGGETWERPGSGLRERNYRGGYGPLPNREGGNNMAGEGEYQKYDPDPNAPDIKYGEKGGGGSPSQGAPSNRTKSGAFKLPKGRPNKVGTKGTPLPDGLKGKFDIKYMSPTDMLGPKKPGTFIVMKDSVGSVYFVNNNGKALHVGDGFFDTDMKNFFKQERVSNVVRNYLEGTPLDPNMHPNASAGAGDDMPTHRGRRVRGGVVVENPGATPGVDPAGPSMPPGTVVEGPQGGRYRVHNPKDTGGKIPLGGPGGGAPSPPHVSGPGVRVPPGPKAMVPASLAGAMALAGGGGAPPPPPPRIVDISTPPTKKAIPLEAWAGGGVGESDPKFPGGRRARTNLRGQFPQGIPPTDQWPTANQDVSDWMKPWKRPGSVPAGPPSLANRFLNKITTDEIPYEWLRNKVPFLNKTVGQAPKLAGVSLGRAVHPAIGFLGSVTGGPLDAAATAGSQFAQQARFGLAGSNDPHASQWTLFGPKEHHRTALPSGHDLGSWSPAGLMATLGLMNDDERFAQSEAEHRGQRLNMLRFGEDYMNPGIISGFKETVDQLLTGGARPDYLRARDEGIPFEDGDLGLFGMPRPVSHSFAYTRQAFKPEGTSQ
jgi:hypothetical protein